MAKAGEGRREDLPAGIPDADIQQQDVWRDSAMENATLRLYCLSGCPRALQYAHILGRFAVSGYMVEKGAAVVEFYVQVVPGRNKQFDEARKQRRSHATVGFYKNIVVSRQARRWLQIRNAARRASLHSSSRTSGWVRAAPDFFSSLMIKFSFYCAVIHLPARGLPCPLKVAWLDRQGNR